MSEPFVGEVRIVAFNFAARGWAFCEGQLLPVSQNTALFSLLGTTYGGDGRSTFALPDLRDRSPVHPGRGPGLQALQLGQRVGSDPVSAVTGATVARGLASTPTGATTVSVYAQPDGGDAAYRPSLGIHFAIALQGLYPSRS
jgi:microcystin-dependent protein